MERNSRLRAGNIAIVLSIWIYKISSICALQEGGDTYIPPAYCHRDVFNATCAHDEVILMTKALYGRMRIGSCLITEFMIGCHADITSAMDGRCSGRRECQVTIPDWDLHRLQPCSDDMNTYLEAEYRCVKVSTSTEQACFQGQLPVKSQSGYLSSLIAQETMHGSERCPWLIQVNPGQRVNVYLLDFSNNKGYQSEDATLHENNQLQCIVHAVIIDRVRHREYPVCASHKRRTLIFTSSGNKVEVKIKLKEEPFNFLLHYEAVGCPDPTPPANAHIRRNGDSVTISCNFTSQTWHLVCKDTSWIGHTQNCTQEKSTVSTFTGGHKSFPSYGLLIAVIIGVSIGIVCGFTMLATVLACRKRRKRYSSRKSIITGEGQSQMYDVALHSPHSQHCKVHRLQNGAVGDYGYTHVWEVQNTPPPSKLTATLPRQMSHPPQYEERTQTLLHTCRDHQYEHPRVDESPAQRVDLIQSAAIPVSPPTTGVPTGTPLTGPFYHEFDPNVIQRVISQPSCGATDDNIVTSDDTDESDNKIDFQVSLGYKIRADKEKHSRRENHYS